MEVLQAQKILWAKVQKHKILEASNFEI